jgi:hypothetical protein
MLEMFTEDWMRKFKDAWNGEAELVSALKSIGFNSVIGYGLDDEESPRGVIVVKDGAVTDAHAYQGDDLNWDLRAAAADWQKWSQKPPGMVGLGMAYTSRKLKFKQGDYAAMIKDPRMAGPFIKSFAVMGRVS